MPVAAVEPSTMESNIMFSRLFCVGLVAATACATPVQPAKAWGGGAFVFGAALGVTTGVLLSRPYYAYPYPYAYPYYAPPPVYAAPAPYGYPYPPAAYAVPPVAGYAPGYATAPAYAPVPGYPPAPGYAVQPRYAPATQPASQLPNCGPGRFFNTLTANCDR